MFSVVKLKSTGRNNEKHVPSETLDSEKHNTGLGQGADVKLVEINCS